MRQGRIVLAGTGSGSGKTWLTCAFLRALSMRGMKLSAFKCGPDYIDPLFHEKVLSIPSRNLDLFFTGEDETRALFLQDNDSDLSVVEGVMGLYDGLGGISEEASTYHLAKVLKAPVLLIVNAHGKGRSLAAEIEGFRRMDEEGLIKGVILNQISKGFYESVKPVIEKLTGIAVLGFLPTHKEWHLESRHLGLKLPEEKEKLLEHLTEAAAELEQTVELDRILSLTEELCEERLLERADYSWLVPYDRNRRRIRIGVAYDEAFCFYYRDNLRLLENAGAELIYFSPIRDDKLPEGISGVLLGGGYPELWAAELAENTGMKLAIRKAIQEGMPSLAECGGFLYLHEGMKTESGEVFPMVGVIPGECYYTGRSLRFGYAVFESSKSSFTIRGHEFHYFESESSGCDWIAQKPSSGRKWKCMHEGEQHIWGFGHLYYPSCPDFPKWFVERCRRYEKTKRLI